MKKMETRTSCEREHDFALVLSGVHDLTPEVMNALFEAGCDDATPSLRFGRIYLTFSRSAPSLKNAILSAIRDVRCAQIGADVDRVDNCHLVTQSEIARRISRTRQLVSLYISGQRGPGGFPPPCCQISEGTPLWAWCEVAYWLRQNNMIKEEAVIDARDVDLINCILEYMHQRQSDPTSIDEVLAELCTMPS